MNNGGETCENWLFKNNNINNFFLILCEKGQNADFFFCPCVSVYTHICVCHCEVVEFAQWTTI